MKRLLAVDLDGTLFFPRRFKKCISKKNVKFLRKWIDNGNRLVLVTSRSHQFTKKLDAEIERPFDVINCTSSQIYLDNKLIRDVKIDNSKLKVFLDEIDKEYKPLGFLITTEDHPIVIKNTGRVGKGFLALYKLYWIFQFSYREEFVLDNDLFDKEIESGKVYKVMIFYGLGHNKNKISREINKKLREEYPEFESSWTSIINEITPKNCDKGSGLEFYCNYLNININDVYVVGDSGNDISMFNRYYEHSYCMKHAHKSVKKYAKHTISRVYKLENKVLKGDNHE